MNEDRSVDAFLSYSHPDAPWVEKLAGRLVDECGFKVWLDRWDLVPGTGWLQAIARGLEQAKCCVIFFGSDTPKGWFQEEISRALDLQAQNRDFRVIPVLLPDADPKAVPGFASLRTWADFSGEHDPDYAFHVLRQGVKGKPIGRWPLESQAGLEDKLIPYEQKFKELARLGVHVHEEVIIEFERKILGKWLEAREDT